MKDMLSPRLYAIASKVKTGDRVLDVGTDHGYIPIYLVQNGISPSAIASDIKAQPLERARSNIASAGLCEKIKTVQTNGARGIDEKDYDSVVVAGMGGIMISEIISEIKDKKHFVLQPMTKAQELREYLYTNGFDITDEKLTREDDKIYVIISAEKTGQIKPFSISDVFVGKKILEGNDPLKDLYLKRLYTRLAKKEAGMKRSKTPDEAGLVQLKQLKLELNIQ